MITYYGYADGSGEYFVAIDSDKCEGCGRCVKMCPKGVLQVGSVFIDLEDKSVAVVKEECCNKLGYLCAECGPERNQSPCVLSCRVGAVKCVFNVC